VKITGLRPATTTKIHELKKKLESHFCKQYGAENIIGCHICYNLKKFSSLITKKESLESKLSELKNNPKKHWLFKKKTSQQRISELEEKLEQTKLKINDLVNKKGVRCTGYAFISFTRISKAHQCLQDYTDPKKIDSRTIIDTENNNIVLSATKAPEKEDILWDNLGYTRGERIGRFLSVNLITFAVIVFMILFLNFTSVLGIIVQLVANATSGYLGSDVANDISDFFVSAIPTTVSLANVVATFIMYGK
jgi:hypothetical protein